MFEIGMQRVSPGTPEIRFEKNSQLELVVIRQNAWRGELRCLCIGLVADEYIMNQPVLGLAEKRLMLSIR